MPRNETLVERLQKGTRLDELDEWKQGSPSLREDLFQYWRTGKLVVQRYWNDSQQLQNIPYTLHSFFFSSDLIQLRQANTSSLKIATWNVNSIRSRWQLLERWLQQHQPDIVGLQETKVEDSQFPAWELRSLGYECAYYGQKSYNGVAILSRHPIVKVCYGFHDQYDSQNCRLISAQIAGLNIVNVYVPQGQTVTSEKFQYKLNFLDQFIMELNTHYSGKQQIVMGDLNIAPDERDVVSAEAMHGKVSFLPEERQRLQQILKLGMVDVYRQFETTDKKFSWWNFRSRGFEKNVGMRIDLILASLDLQNQLKSCLIDIENRAQAQPSDHAPVICELKEGINR